MKWLTARRQTKRVMNIILRCVARNRTNYEITKTCNSVSKFDDSRLSTTLNSCKLLLTKMIMIVCRFRLNCQHFGHLQKTRETCNVRYFYRSEFTYTISSWLLDLASRFSDERNWYSYAMNIVDLKFLLVFRAELMLSSIICTFGFSSIRFSRHASLNSLQLQSIWWSTWSSISSPSCQ